MKTEAYKFWVYAISDGNSKGLLIKRQASPSTVQKCKYFYFAGGLSPTFEILHACRGCYVQLAGNKDEKRFVDGLIDYIQQDQAAGGTKIYRMINKEATDGQTYQVVVNHFFGRVESPLLDFFISSDIFKQSVLCKVRNKDEYIGMAEEFGVLSPHNLTVNDLKYIRPIEKVLKAGEENKAQWFRKSGPLAIDFDNNFICPREEILNDLKHKVLNNFGSLLEGDMATGKTVLVRYLGYTLRKDMPVYYFDCGEKRDFDFEILAAQVNNLRKGAFILENIHLETQKFQLFFSRLQPDKAKHILFTTRPSFRETHTDRFEAIETLPRIPLEPFNDVDSIINHFAQHHSNVSWSAEIYAGIKNVSRNNFWLLSYALMGYIRFQGMGKPAEWLESEVEADLKDLDNIDAGAPNVVVTLSALYQNEVLTSAKYLLDVLKFNHAMLRKLVIAGEITTQVIDDNIFYGLPHSALAMAYWEHGTVYRNLLEYPIYEDFIYNYAISGVPNGLTAIRTSSADIVSRLYKRVAEGDKAKDIFVTQIDRTIFRGYVDRLFFFPSIEPKAYYYSDSVLLFLGHCLLKRNYMHELSRLLRLRSFNLKQFWIELDKDILESVLYDNPQTFNDGCCCIKILYNCSDLRPSIKNFLNSSKIALLANESDDPSEIFCSLNHLLRTDIEFAVKYWENLDKDKAAHLLILRSYYKDNSPCIVYEYVIDIYKSAKDIELDNSTLCHFSLAQKKQLKKLIEKITMIIKPILADTKIIEMTIQAIENANVMTQTLNELSQISPDLALSYWKALDKKLLKKYFGRLNVSDHLQSLSIYHEQIKLNICTFIEEVFIPNAHKYRDVNTIAYAVMHFFDIDMNITLKFWDRIDKDIIIKMLFHCKPNDYVDSISCFLNPEEMFAKTFWRNYVDRKVLETKIQLADLNYVAYLINQILWIDADFAQTLCNKYSKLWLQELSDDEEAVYSVQTLLLLCKIRSTYYDAFAEKLCNFIEKYTEEFMSLKSIEDVVEDPCFMADVAPLAAKRFYECICNKYSIEAFIKQHRYSKHGWHMVPDCQNFLSMIDPEDKQGWKQYFHNIE